MPWSVGDVDSHKKGLSDKGKVQWCRIANSVLKRCMAKGGDEKTCAASAIRQANGVVNANADNNSYSAYKNKQVLDYEIKLTVHQEKAHLVAPVVMMVEGVHKGSQGALFHSIDELGKFPASWNGIPIVIYHPTEDGEPVSANVPEIIDKEIVGRVYNTNVDGKKLKAEAWFDEDKLNTVSPVTLQSINDNEEVELSLGMFTENEMVEGEYEGKKYEGIAKNHRPDHLAILPDQVGACSIEDGCGIGANKKKKDIQSSQETEIAGIENDDNKLIRTKFKKEDKTMPKNECPKCLKKINDVIANKESGFVEADREWLEVLSEAALDKTITPKVIEKEKVVEKTVEVNKLSPEDQADLAWAKKQRKEKKEKLIKAIQDNTEKGTWDDAVLNGMTDDLLERVFKSVKKEETVDYSLMGGGIQVNAGGEEPLLPTGIAFEEPKK